MKLHIRHTPQIGVLVVAKTTFATPFHERRLRRCDAFPVRKAMWVPMLYFFLVFLPEPHGGWYR
jgi:hypothetical protein